MRTSAGTTSALKLLRGTLRRRVLVNAVVDPDEAASHLPSAVRPHVIEHGTVVGCCLIEISELRPAHLPAVAGVTLRAAAHRISVEWDDESGEPIVGVYVPARHTDSRLAIALGGRWFPGVHHRAQVDIGETSAGLTWQVGDTGRAQKFGIRVVVRSPQDQLPVATTDPVGGTCLGATIGLSPDRTGELEGARMDLKHRRAREVAIDDLHSDFLSSFSSATPAPSYLMANIDVTWTPARAPRLTPAAARA